MYSREIANQIEAYLESEGWNYYFDEKNDRFSTYVKLPGEMKFAHYHIILREDFYTVTAFCPLGSENEYQDEHVRKELMEFICRANDGMIFGNFEYDVDKGFILFKNTITCLDCEPGRETIHQSMMIPGSMLVKYSSGIVKVLFENWSGKDACGFCEGTLLSDSEEETDDDEVIDRGVLESVLSSSDE